jgi:phosphoribosylformylglycinamidine cyclo-ligase
MYRVFNMGLGMVMVVSDNSAEAVSRRLRRDGETVYRIGRIVPGRGRVRLR